MIKSALICFSTVMCLFALSACDKFSGGDQQNEQPTSLSNYVGSGAPSVIQTPSAQTQQTATMVQSNAPVEQSGQPALPAPSQTKIYTYQGNVFLPPNAYMSTQNNNVDNINICGTASPDQTATAENYCFKFSELSNRLYDADHSGLDVWDLQNGKYLFITKSQDKDTPVRELWVETNKFGVYHPYADIMQQKLLFLGDWSYQTQPAWPVQAYDGPGGNVIEIKKESYPEKKSQNPMVMITAVAQSPQKELWFKLNLINSLCDGNFSTGGTTGASASPSPVLMNIWYPAYRLEGNLRIPTVWFSAKGC